MTKALSLVWLSCFASISALRRRVPTLQDPNKDTVLSDEMVNKMRELYPEWDEPFALPEKESFAEAYSPKKRSSEWFQSTYKHYDDRLMCRKSMWDKLRALKNERVIVMSKPDFVNGQKTGAILRSLPSSGAVIFVVDDPWRSKDSTVTCGNEKFLDDARILAVSAEDHTCHHAKMSGLPMGIESKILVGHYGKSVLDMFVDLMQHPLPFNERKNNVQSDAHLHIFKNPKSKSILGADRADMVKRVRQSAVDDWYRGNIDMLSHFKNHISQTKFSLCPEGNGMDTHRFYHNYALHTRCIVRDGALTKLHREFPGTIVVDNWGQVTTENVKKWSQESTAAYDPNLLTSKYWINKLLNKFNIEPSIQ